MVLTFSSYIFSAYEKNVEFVKCFHTACSFSVTLGNFENSLSNFLVYFKMYTFFSRLLEARIRPSGALFITEGSFKQVILLLMKRSSKETVELGYCQSHILKDYWSCLQTNHTVF